MSEEQDTTPSKTQSALQLLEEADRGNNEALDQLLPLVYGELKDMAAMFLRRVDRGHTLQPTALVHEAYLRLVGHQKLSWNGRTHLMAVASKAMRQTLVDHYRRRQAAKRGAGLRRITLLSGDLAAPDGEVDFLSLQEALERLEELDPRQSRVVELRFFGGLTMEEIAAVLGVSKTTAEEEWRHARAWLARELKK